MLNLLWPAFFLVGFLAALYQAFNGQPEVFATVVTKMFEAAKTAFEIALGLTGMMCLWLGLLKIAEQAGLVAIISRGLTPLFHRLMPGVPAGHPAFGSMTMNIVANMLGLDNAATPLGLKAMKDLQEVNPNKDTASNAQILFLVINASSVTLIPVSILAQRVAQHAAAPTSVFVPILLATAGSTLAGLISVAVVQRINLFHPVVLAYLGAIALAIASLVSLMSGLTPELMQARSLLIANFIIFALIVAFLVAGWGKKVPVYEAFIEGAKEGFEVAVRIIPYLVAMLVGVAAIRYSGVLDGVLWGIAATAESLGLDTRFVPALPTALIKPFSGSGARGLMVEAMETYGPDSFVGNLACVIQGSTETTFYVLAVYFGSVGIRKTRHAVSCGLIAEAAGVISAIFVAYWFFGSATS